MVSILWSIDRFFEFEPAVLAAMDGGLECLKVLLGHGVSIETKSTSGHTLLSAAISCGDNERRLRTMKFLLERSADIARRSSLGQTIGN